LYRETRSLSGPWFFQREGADPGAWKTVSVPSSFQSHEGDDFHGVGWYRKTVAPLVVPEGRRALLRFQAAATFAEVWCDGRKVGAHLGGWTPFRCDITEIIRTASPDRSHELRVRLDERVGHNTQGFLPVIAPHFGGLWQDVALDILPETYLDDLAMLAVGDPDSRCMRLEIPLRGARVSEIRQADIHYRRSGMKKWTAVSCDVPTRRDRDQTNAAATIDDGVLRVTIPVADMQLWSPAQPTMYETVVRIAAKDGKALDEVATRIAFRHIEARGDQLLLNGRPLQVRGMLNWGYAAPQAAPAITEQRYREELQAARSLGCNLMKFCLWVPPRRYLELADEMGVLVWLEYPTWHAKLTRPYADDLAREFAEFLAHDRNHAAVVLRSLTCESGQDVDQAVIHQLYDLAHRMVPGSIVEDNSSWIGWNKIHDFYDDHPYGNCHTWVDTLAKLRDYIRQHGAKPLVLGEAIAADTWVPPEAFAASEKAERPFWVPKFIADERRWLEQMTELVGADGVSRLRADSVRYAFLARKYQIETYRKEVPSGGYVLSVLRDFSTASMGFLDYAGKLKWTPAEWAWHQDTTCLLHTPHDRRTFFSGERLTGTVLVSHFGASRLAGARMTVSAREEADRGLVAETSRDVADLDTGSVWPVLKLDMPVPVVDRPRRLLLQVRLTTASARYENEWPIWVVPTQRSTPPPRVRLHAADVMLSELFPCAPRLAEEATEDVVVARRLDARLLRLLQGGGRVLLLPDGKANSFPLAAHWFLRGGPCVPASPLFRAVPRELLVDTQQFDLAGDVIPDVSYLDRIDPLFMLWDTHDLDRVKTHGLVFQTRVGKGHLLVSALGHHGSDNAAGRWLLDVFVEHLRAGPAPKLELTVESLRQLLSRR
jgi:hypothetical protein